MSTRTAAGGVYDVGYRPYDGPRGGRGAARAALWRLSVRRAVGLRRSWRQKLLPWALLGVTTIPAAINVGIKYLTKDTPGQSIDLITYREYVGVSTALLLFVALTAPDIICPDRRNRVLPLLFARPIDGRDYVIAKVGAIAGVVFAFSFIPQVVLFVGQMLVATGGALGYFTDNAEVLWQVPVAVAGLALYYAAIGVALAATTTRRVVGGVAMLATVLVTSAVGNILVEVNTPGGADSRGSAWAVVDVLGIPLHVRDLVFLGHLDPEGPMSGVNGGGAMVLGAYVLIVTVSIVFLLRRYREVRLS